MTVPDIMPAAAICRGLASFRSARALDVEPGEDERDRAASQRAWALAGVVGFFGNVVVGAVGAFGGPMTPALAIVLWLQMISFIGGNIYFDRTM